VTSVEKPESVFLVWNTNRYDGEDPLLLAVFTGPTAGEDAETWRNQYHQANQVEIEIEEVRPYSGPDVLDWVRFTTKVTVDATGEQLEVKVRSWVREFPVSLVDPHDELRHRATVQDLISVSDRKYTVLLTSSGRAPSQSLRAEHQDKATKLMGLVFGSAPLAWEFVLAGRLNDPS